MEANCKIAHEIAPGVIIYLLACRCSNCKNFFFIPQSDIDSDPSNCCFCGIRLTVTERNADFTEELTEVFETVDYRGGEEWRQE